MLNNLRTCLNSYSIVSRLSTIVRHYFFLNYQVDIPQLPDLTTSFHDLTITDLSKKKNNFKIKKMSTKLPQAGFNLVFSSNSSEVKLIKVVKDKMIEINYQTTQLADYNTDNITKDIPDIIIDFTIAIKDKNNELLLNCHVSEGNLNIDNVICNLGEITDRGNTGYDYIDNKFKETLIRYVISMGVTKEILEFIASTGVNRDEKKFMGWFKVIKGIKEE